MTNSDPLLTPTQAAEYVTETTKHLMEEQRRRRVAAVRLGYRTVRFRQSDLDAYILRVRQPAVWERKTTRTGPQ